MTSSQKERRKLLTAERPRRVEEAINLRQFRGQSSKECFRELAVKYFIEYPNVKLRLRERLRAVDDLKLSFYLNGSQLTWKVSYLSILEVFAAYSKEQLITIEGDSSNLVDFLEFLDSIEELAERVRIETDEAANSQRVKLLMLRATIKDYFRRKEGRNLANDSSTVKKFYKISYLDFDDPCHYTDKDILIQYDGERKLQPPQPSEDRSLGEFTDVLNHRRELHNHKEIEQVRLDMLRKQYPETFEEVKRSLPQPQRIKNETPVQIFVREWIGGIDLSLKLFATKQKKFLEGLAEKAD